MWCSMLHLRQLSAVLLPSMSRTTLMPMCRAAFLPLTDECCSSSGLLSLAWEKVSSNKGAIVRSFKKCGISLPIDGSQDSEINIMELIAYTVGRFRARNVHGCRSISRVNHFSTSNMAFFKATTCAKDFTCVCEVNSSVRVMAF